MYIEFKDKENITIKPSDDELALPPEKFFSVISNATVGIIWEIARLITVDEKDLADIARNYSDAVHRMIRLTASRFEEELKPNGKKTGFGEELYAAMEGWFDDFIERGNHEEEKIISIASNMKNPRPCTNICEGKFCFDICSDDKRIINIGSVDVNADEQRIETERVMSSAIAIVLFDKAFEDEGKHPMRGENSHMFPDVSGLWKQ